MTDPAWQPVWLRDDLALVLHERLVADFGGLAGVRDQGLLESALARPRQLAAYGGIGIVELAAAYAAGIVRNHPFIDGNKRVAFMLAYVFLVRNGYRFTASEAAATRAVLDLASGALTEEAFTRWLGDHSEQV
jgi:death-on-curing protein